MNIDLDSQMQFGDAAGLEAFLFNHRFVHEQISVALHQQYGQSVSSFGLLGSEAERAWVELMQADDPNTPTPSALRDWLDLHAQLHVNEFAILGGSAGVGPPDLSQVSFASPDQFYDWMDVHQEMHDYEQSALGFT